MGKPFQNKSILITGASSGLGNSLARKSAELGGKVFVASRNTSSLNQLADEINGKGECCGEIIPVKTDIRSIESVKSLFEEIDKVSQKIDLVINNAAIGHNSKLQDIPVEEIQDILKTNLLGTIYVTREAISRMLDQQDGHIAFISSLAGKLAFPNLSIYSSTKFAIEGLAESIREELNGLGINITIIRPGMMKTNFFKTAGMDEFARTMQHKMQSPDDVANEAIQSIMRKDNDITIGTDKRFMPFLKILPKSLARKLLPYIT